MGHTCHSLIKYKEMKYLLNLEFLCRFGTNIKDTSERQGFRRIALILGALGFAIGLTFAIKSQPNLLHNIRWGLACVVLAVGVPLAIVGNAFEFKLSGAFMHRNIPFPRALEISIIASAANMLPLPGGVATRVIALKSYKISYKDGITINFLFAFIWAAIALLFAGICLLPYEIWMKWIFLVVGLGTGFGSLVWAGKRNIPMKTYCLAVLQRLFMVFLGALRLWLCLLALGISAGFGQAAVFVVGSIVGSVVSVVPAGLGFREGVSAGLAPIVGLAAASGFLAAALNRLLGLLILFPSALSIGLFQYKSRKEI